MLSLREKEFVEASRSLGSTNWRIMAREILPNVAAPLIVYTTLIIPANILFEAGLSFLGVGVPDTSPSWGAMLAASGTAFRYAAWLMIFPGLALFMTTLAFNLVGDGIARRTRSSDPGVTVSQGVDDVAEDDPADRTRTHREILEHERGGNLETIAQS